MPPDELPRGVWVTKFASGRWPAFIFLTYGLGSFVRVSRPESAAWLRLGTLADATVWGVASLCCVIAGVQE